MSPPTRLLLLITGVVALVAGVLGGLARLGWAVPGAVHAGHHGVLLVGAFFGTVIGLERAVALGRPWGYIAPLLAGIAGLLVVTGGPLWIAAPLLVGASAVFSVIALVFVARQPALFIVVMAAGALAWLAANMAWWVGWPVSDVVAGWVAFLVLTIAGERIELSRMLRPRRDRALTAPVPLVLVLAGAAWIPFDRGGGRLLGLGLLVLTAWLLRHDIAQRTVRQAGLTRYMAVCLLSGYAWLAVGGGLAIVHGMPVAGPIYDAILHAVFVGFVFSMVFGHAPVIVPSVLRVAVPYHPVLYVPLVLLHATLALRVGGDLWGDVLLRRWGGMGSALALLVFGVTMLTRVLAGRVTRGGAPPRRSG